MQIKKAAMSNPLQHPAILTYILIYIQYRHSCTQMHTYIKHSLNSFQGVLQYLCAILEWMASSHSLVAQPTFEIISCCKSSSILAPRSFCHLSLRRSHISAGIFDMFLLFYRVPEPCCPIYEITFWSVSQGWKTFKHCKAEAKTSWSWLAAAQVKTSPVTGFWFWCATSKMPEAPLGQPYKTFLGTPLLHRKCW